MKGVSYLVDESGCKTAVVLDLRRHRRLWESVYDRLLIGLRRSEQRETLDQVHKSVQRRHRKFKSSC
jgi:hypothetical protein